MLKNKTKAQIKQKFNFNPYRISSANNLLEAKETKETKEEPSIGNYIPVSSSLTFIDIPNYLELPNFNYAKPLLICLFHIVTNGFQPFVLFLLQKGKTALQLINVPTFDGGKKNKKVKQTAIAYMEEIMQAVDFACEIDYAGFMDTTENNIIFLNYHPSEDFRTIPSVYYWATSYELINTKQVLNIPIAPATVNLFMDFPALIMLKNSEDIIYASPVVGYYTTTDLYKETVIESLGKCYYLYASVPSIYTNAVPVPVTRCVFFPEKITLNKTMLEPNTTLFTFINNKSYYIFKNYKQQLEL